MVPLGRAGCCLAEAKAVFGAYKRALQKGGKRERERDKRTQLYIDFLDAARKSLKGYGSLLQSKLLLQQCCASTD